MGDHQGRPGAVNMGPFVGVDLYLFPTVSIAVIVLTRTYNESIPSWSRHVIRLTLSASLPRSFSYSCVCKIESNNSLKTPS